MFLVFKEAVNNIARHSGCRKASAVLAMEGAFVVLKVADDGRGFHPAASGNGRGLKSMRERAQSLGGAIEIASRPQGGAAITFRAPWRRPRPGWKSFLHRGIGVRGRDSS